jgi:uncharacterized protein
LRRAEKLLFAGQRVLVDATFRDEKWRRAFLTAAVRWGVPAVFLLCRADPAIARERLEHRHRDISDADWQVYQSLAQSWQELSAFAHSFLCEIFSGGSAEETLDQGLQTLRAMGLHRERRKDGGQPG